MISVVCVYNNEAILKVALLRSLQSHTATFEPILLDNRDSRYKSAAQALNEGARRATGDFIMFVHQDRWLADAERSCDPCWTWANSRLVHLDWEPKGHAATSSEPLSKDISAP